MSSFAEGIKALAAQAAPIISGIRLHRNGTAPIECRSAPWFTGLADASFRLDAGIASGAMKGILCHYATLPGYRVRQARLPWRWCWSNP